MTKQKTLLRVALAAALASHFAIADAAYINTPLPSNAYITHNGLDWAWAFPLPAASGLDLSFQSAYGWHIASAAELALAPLATDFLFSGGNVPFNGTDPVSGAYFSAVNAGYTGNGACATPYFSNSYRHCDWQDGLGQTYGPWAGMANAFGFADQLVVRQAVPEPGSLPLVAIAVGALAFTLRKKAASK